MFWRPPRRAVASRPSSSCLVSAATTPGVIRDAAARFLGIDVEQSIYAKDPFVSIDVEGVGKLRGRKTRPDIKLGICGEHADDPASIAFCEKVGLDYVSASPFEIPAARLAAAQAALFKDR